METKNTYYVCSMVALQVLFFVIAKYNYGFDISSLDFKMLFVGTQLTTLLSIGVILSRNTYYHCFYQFFQITFVLGVLLAPPMWLEI